MGRSTPAADADQFDAFVRNEGRRLQHSLVAAHGLTVGSDATQAALVYGWEHWTRVAAMANPAGYLYRVGQNAARREYRPAAVPERPLPATPPAFEPQLVEAMRELTEHQRVAVLLVHGHGYRLNEVAGMIDVSVSTLRNHLERGLKKLRRNLGVENEHV